MRRSNLLLWTAAVLTACVDAQGFDGDVFNDVTSSSTTSTTAPLTDTTAAVESSSETTAVADADSSSSSSSSAGAQESSTGELTTCGNGTVDPGEVCFVEQELLLAAGSGAWDVAVADYDLDGHLDIATLEADANTVSIRLGDGARGFSEPESFAATSQGFRLRAGDLDGDGDFDLVAIGTAVTVLNNHAGVLEAVTDTGFGLFPDQLNDAVLGELNVTAGLDLVHTTTLSMYTQGGAADGNNWDFGNGVPIFSVDTEDASGLAVAPWAFDDDEIADVLYLNRTSEYAQVMTSNGTGGLQVFADAWVCPTGTGAYNATIGDLDGDDNQDLVVSCSTDQFAVVPGLGDGTFAEKELYDVPQGALRPIITDVDADGDPDVVITAAGAGQLQVFTNDGSGTLDLAIALSLGALVRPVDHGDLDEDGAVDLVTAFTDARGDFTAVFWSDP